MVRQCVLAKKRRKEYNYKMTQEGPETQTLADVEKDCDAVNHSSASKINDSGHSAHQRTSGKDPLPQMEEAIWECGGADLEGPSSKLGSGSQASGNGRWKRA